MAVVVGAVGDPKRDAVTLGGDIIVPARGLIAARVDRLGVDGTAWLSRLQGINDVNYGLGAELSTQDIITR